MPTTTMNLTQACQRLGITPKTMKVWLDDGVFPGARFDDRKGRGVWIIPIEPIEAMYRKLHGENTSSIDTTSNDDTLSTITQELESLKARVQALETLIASIDTDNTTKPAESIVTTEQRQPERLGTIPEGYVSFVAFYQQHGIPETSAGRWRKGPPIRATEGYWQDDKGHPVKYVLSPDQQWRFYQDMNERESFVRCPGCLFRHKPD